jgi:biopolymer transport protein ExbB
MIVLEYFLHGGLAMWAILFCLLLTLMASVDRAVTLKRSRFESKPLLMKIRSLLAHNDVPAATEACASLDSPTARIFRQGIASITAERLDLKATIANAVNMESRRMEKSLNILASMAVVSTMLGLLGSVISIILLSQTAERLGEGASAVFLARAVGESMYALAFGLIVGILSYGTFRFYLGVTKDRMLECELSGSDFLELSRQLGEKPEERSPTQERNVRTVFSEEDDFFELKH